MRKTRHTRNGNVATLLCFLSIPLLGLLAFSVDYGFLLYIRTDLQRTADQAATAAVRDLIPAPDGTQDLAKVRATVREYVRLNLGDEFVVNDEDIEIGRYDPATIYSSVTLKNDGVFDTVRVTIRRNDLTNNSVSLYFARLFKTNHSDVSASATAVLQKAKYIGPGTAILPVAIEQKAWNRINTGDVLRIYGDGRLESASGGNIPGNWGTIDIGATSNSTNTIKRQIETGLSQGDLDSLHRQGVIPSSEYIDGASTIEPNGDTGFSGGIKNSLDAEIGNTKVLPIYKKATGQGGRLTFEVVGWAVAKIYATHWNGGKHSRLEIQKSYTYEDDLRPNPDLSDTSKIIEGAFTSPVLIE